MKKILILFFFLQLCQIAKLQVVILDNSLEINKILNLESDAIRIAENPVNGKLYYSTISGNIYEINLESESTKLISSTADHDLSNVQGFTIGPDGTYYIVATIEDGAYETGYIKKGDFNGTSVNWNLLAKTEQYIAGSGRDHQLNEAIVTRDSAYLLVNIGSRSDHGEENAGFREIPITSCIVKIPIDSNNLILYNDSTLLAPYFFADGVRNTFDMAFAPDGKLFGLENSDTRDNHEEMNWLQQGHHYGFPWRMGIYDNPQQFPDFDPPTSDPLLVEGINMESTFHKDPDFPKPIAGISFTDPVLNSGPDNDKYRDPVTGEIKDGSDNGELVGSFTPHSSPLALTFDVDSLLPDKFKGKGFYMSYNSSTLKKYAPFNDPGEDLCLIDLYTELDDETTYYAGITRIAEGFSHPVDAVSSGQNIYIIETAGGSLYKVSFTSIGTDFIENTRTNNNSITICCYNSRVYIKSDDYLSGLIKISVFTTQGILVQQKTVSANNATTRNLEMQLDNLKKGIYIITVENENNFNTSKYLNL